MKRNVLLLNGLLALSIGLLLTGTLGACDKGRKSKDKIQREALASADFGDMTAFKKIAEDALVLVENGQMPEAKAKIKELESSWDDAESTMKPRNPSKWNSIDKSIDKALAEVRSSKPDKGSCVAALKTAIAKFAVYCETGKMKDAQPQAQPEESALPK